MQSKSGPTDIQRRTETRQLAELSKLQAIEAQKTAAAGRRTRGRASLISGSERGMTSPAESAAFTAANVETSNILGVRADTAAKRAAELEAKKKQSLLVAEGAKTERRQRKSALDPVGGLLGLY